MKEGNMPMSVSIDLQTNKESGYQEQADQETRNHLPQASQKENHSQVSPLADQHLASQHTEDQKGHDLEANQVLVNQKKNMKERDEENPVLENPHTTRQTGMHPVQERVHLDDWAQDRPK